MLFPRIFGLSGVLYDQPIADVFSAIITAFMAAHLRKELSATKVHYLAIQRADTESSGDNKII